MEKQNILNEVVIFLEKYNICTLEMIKEQTINQLVSIESYFKNCNEIYSEILLNLEYINLTTRGVCKNSGISKSTVYNHSDVLKKYIECRINDIECNVEIVSKGTFKKLEEENEALKEVLDKILIDKIKYIKLKDENTELKEQLAKAHKDINLIKQERREFINKINELERTAYNKNNILEFRK